MQNNFLQYLPENVKQIIIKSLKWISDEIIEIRLRINQPLHLITYKKEYFLTSDGLQANSSNSAYKVNEEDLKRAMLIITDNSIYAMERQLQEGFITIKGGHRIGFTGQVVVKEGKIKIIKNINSLNYRITRQVLGVADCVVHKLYNRRNDLFYNTLIISPPLCGKTTLLRDLIRVISTGIPEREIKGKKIGVVDERSELGGSYKGIPQNKIGIRTDLLDNCPKAEGMLLLIRAMSPDIIAVDEIGRKQDMTAIKEAINSGVTLFTTVHGRTLNSIKRRSDFKNILSENLFQRFIILSKRKGIGTIEKVINHLGEEID